MSEYEFKDQLENKSYAELLEMENVLANKILVQSVLGTGSSITNTKITGELEVVAGVLKSANYVAGTSGWQLTPTSGELNFAVSVDSLDIPDLITANSFHVDVDGNAWWGATTLAGALAAVLKTGVASFKSITLDTNVIIKDMQAGSVVDGQYINSLNVSKLVTGTISSKQITLAITGGSGDSYIGAGKTDFTNVQTGFILGLDDSDGDTPKFFIGDATTYLNWDGTTLIVAGAIKPNIVANDDLLLSADTERLTANLAYTLVKQITIQFGGTLRIKFDMHSESDGAGADVHGKVYRNSVAVGAERTRAFSTYGTFSEDIAGWKTGDICELYCNTINVAIDCIIRNFRIYGTILTGTITTD